ncbi:class V aminotransferase [candidate division WOR-1 bacterium RIFOXYB2_FULL_42_35]|uniref:Tritium exchange subunit n=1 Tax=candidate division WOR-1 bacterium RIFOXYC2_FULL_41_25 TaxID=1802586 RepID=A0A1F4TMG4_UNCSA|nr:MAG: class V aminotransferase [candidate division WOR-1 bacterium RIFOXYA2_FULL_41_14]OGC23884.1 MAG: class V aminotransferase [candidate division WOR-1 bacterium RIFOXYB2_FULL_42_35]OGC33759.1 MAG: class V aminotransferase [candidate division WOR-1 bacterium RIFOXYC2_FULL_41_25]OGC44180.1 MAG: class V aminotransferase [candidate division WOR-1 bacterium RIFOXYD2_FULL_41_8]
MTDKKPLKQYLMIPGPTPIPTEILSAMSHEMIGHRGPVFSKILAEVIEGLKWAYQTKNDVMVFPCSGTGGMETAVVNTLSAGDKALFVNIGNFGDRWIKIAKTYGVDAIDLKVERGTACDPKVLAAELAKDSNKEIKAVFMQQNETSTGVINDVKALAAVVRKSHPDVLILVDAVSGLLTADLKSDDWDLDVVVSGSQKAFMVPPGIAAVSMSKRAWKAYESSTLPKHYWDIKVQKKFADKGQTYTTPPESIIFGMHKAVEMLKKEGLENIFERHAENKKIVRAGLKGVGCKLLADDVCSSPAVTAIFPPDGVDAEKVRSEMRNRFGVELAPGQGDLKGKIFRIGHLGYVDKLELVATIGALELLFSQMGAPVEIGKGTKAALEQIK